MKKNGHKEYTIKIGQQFVDEISAVGLINGHLREKIRSIQVLDDFLSLGYVRTRRTIPVIHPLFGKIGEQMERHITNLEDLRQSHITIKRNRVYMNRFLVFLDREGVNEVDLIKHEHIAGFLSSPLTNNSHVMSTLRVLFNFWHSKGITSRNLSDSLAFFKPKRREKIPSYYGKDEIQSFENTIDTTSAVGKRDYATLLLASRLGLRASDIVGLKFANIDWEKNEIRLNQYKTGKPITLPLLAEVGNAIIDYLKYGRPNSNSQQIFLSQRPPYGNARSQTISAAISRAIVKSGVKINGRRHGSHSMRHSLASRLLEQETSIPIISETLGHTTSETTMGYLRIDIGSLLKCALTVTEVHNDFYNQKGGVFYE